MIVSLPKLAREAGVRNPRATLPMIVVPKTIEDELYSIYLDGVRAWRKGIVEQIIPNYEIPSLTLDATPAQLDSIIANVARTVEGEVYLYQTAKLGRWVRRVGDWNGAKVISGAKSATGVDIAPYMRLIDVQGQLDQAIRDNVSLFRSHNAATRARIEAILADALVNRRNKKYLTAELAKALGISQRRARFAATDQTHKLSAALTSLRNQELGIPGYRWITRRDERVRHLHAVRQGDYFRWDKPPSDGPPGWPIRCRCVAHSVLYEPDED